MKKLSSLFLAAALPALSLAQGWPAHYGGVMLQGFYWDSFSASKWKNLEKQADELSQYFDLVWVPQSGKAQNGTSMGYDVLYYYNQNSSFGTEAQLRSMISSLKQRGTGVVADVVVNHRATLSSWVDFPAETYQGKSWQMLSTDIVANDDNGATKRWAESNGYSLSANNDEGEGWDGMRDLDHKSANVQECVKAYTRYLLDDLGYTGFRYDMVKGFSGKHVADYNRNAGVEFSVGEYWDGNASLVKRWIDQTKVEEVPQSAAFDFPFRYTCRDAVSGDWSKLKNASLMSDEAYRQFSVTFIENHDTERRQNAEQDPIKSDTLALNAWMLSMPGTPCVFLKHWQEWKQDIKNMIELRRLVGIDNQSAYSEFAANKSYCVRKVTGQNGQLAVAVGAYTGGVGNAFQEVLAGYHYRLFVQKSLNTVWMSTPSGVYDEGVTLQVALNAITDGQSMIVYTLDGSEPTASNGTQVASGSVLNIDHSVTLKAGLLIDGQVTGVQSRQYIFQAEEPNDYEPWDMHVYVRSEVALFNQKMNFYVWAGDDDTQLNGSWPGRQVTEKVSLDGYSWFTQSFRIDKEGLLPVNFVFSTGSGSPQTVDVVGFTADAWLVIRDQKDGGKYVVDDVTSQYSSLDAVIRDLTPDESLTYDLQGHPVKVLVPGQLYLRGGRKFIVK